MAAILNFPALMRSSDFEDRWMMIDCQLPMAEVSERLPSITSKIENQQSSISNSSYPASATPHQLFVLQNVSLRGLTPETHKKSEVPFDIRSKRIIFYEDNRELERELERMLARTLADRNA